MLGSKQAALHYPVPATCATNWGVRAASPIALVRFRAVPPRIDMLATRLAHLSGTSRDAASLESNPMFAALQPTTATCHCRIKTQYIDTVPTLALTLAPRRGIVVRSAGRPAIIKLHFLPSPEVPMSAWHRRAVVVPSVVAVIVAGALVVHAQTTNGDVIHGCVGQAGMLRVVSENEPCRSGEAPISWGSGLSGYEIVTSDFLFPPNVTSMFGSHSVDCPTGKRVLGGGAAALVGSSSNPSVGAAGTLSFGHASYPADEDTWTVTFNWGGVVGVGLRVYATCAQ